MTTEFNEGFAEEAGTPTSKTTKVEAQTTNEAPKKKRLGVSKDLQAKAGIPIGAPKRLDKRTDIYPNSWEFPVVRLSKVHFEPEQEIKRNGDTEKVPVLKLLFTQEGGKQFTQVYFPIDEDDENFEKKVEELSQHVKHIFDETIGTNNFEEGSMEGDDFTELFDNMAKAFNAKTITKGEGEAAKLVPYFYTQPVYLKLSFYKERAQMPKFPNFVQKANGAKGAIPCELIINPKYDKVEAQAPAASGTPYAGGAQNNSFGGEADFGDFPTIPNN